MPGPLAGVTVLDFTQLIAGPFATRMLADYGADVVKIEPPGGEPGRRLKPLQGTAPDPERSGLFFALNTNKRSVVIDAATAGGQQALLALARRADLVVESFPPGVMARLGLGYDALAKVRPDIVLASLTSFGQTGPWRDWTVSETVLYAMGGDMYHQGLDGREPLKQGGTVTTIQVGAMAAAACMAALLARGRSGRGGWLDLSMYEMQSASNDRRVQTYMVYQFANHIARRQPGVAEAMGIGIFPCADGYIETYADPLKWERLVRLLGNPPNLLDERWTMPGARSALALKEEFDAVWLPWLLARTRREAWEDLQSEGILSGPLYTAEDLASDPHFEARGFWSRVEHAAMGEVTFPGRPFLMSKTPWALHRPAPRLGEHTAEVLGEAGVALSRAEGRGGRSL